MSRRRTVLVMLALAASVPARGVAQAPAPAQAPPPDLARARAAWERAPTNVDSIVWYGRRIAYTGDFAAAIAIYSEGLRHHPDEPHLLRHRGHRYLSVRQFEAARADLQRAQDIVAGTPDEVEPDGQPNARGIPTSTLHSNIRYHLALAHFLLGDFRAAGEIWEEDARVAANLDQRVAATYWWVLSLARQGRAAEARAALAPIRADWDIIENGSYHAALLWMQGSLSETALRARMTTTLERHTIGNGIGQWELSRGNRTAAAAAFREVLATGPSASFGYLAAEANLVPEL